MYAAARVAGGSACRVVGLSDVRLVEVRIPGEETRSHTWPGMARRRVAGVPSLLAVSELVWGAIESQVQEEGPAPGGMPRAIACSASPGLYVDLIVGRTVHVGLHAPVVVDI